jgi:carboxypeptidase PM20D1
MPRLTLLCRASLLPMLLFAAPAIAHPVDAPAAQALDILKHAIAYRSVRGAGNQTPQLAAYIKEQLLGAGFAPEDVTVTPYVDTAFLTARLRGRDPSLKPLLLSGHIDVVEAKPADWQRDPFTPVIENGYIFGRGATDMKFDVALMLTALTELKRTRTVPARDVILVLSGDEETSMKTTQAIAAKFSDAFMLLNGDSGGGSLSDDGKPMFFALEGAEKAYADYEISVASEGGHSSEPRKDNAIYQLARALIRIGDYQFPTQLDEINRAYFLAAADRAEPKLAAAMRAYVANPSDAAAIATLRANPLYVGKLGTTCVATMASAGHAENALPQRASANINCRIFPGTSFEQVQDRLKRAIGDANVTIRFMSAGTTTTSPASPLRPDISQAVRAGLDAAGYKGVPVLPSMGTGASDSMWFRARGVPCYGVAPIFIKDSEDFSHGLNERTPLFNLARGVTFWETVVMRLAG